MDTVGRMLSYLYTLDYEDIDNLTIEELNTNTVVTHDLEALADADELPEVTIEALRLPTHPEKDLDNANTAETHRMKVTHTRMLNNISVHAIADKYDIPTLKLLATIKFKELVNSMWPHHDFPAIIKAVYESSCDTVQDLRTVVTSVCRHHVEDLLMLKGSSASEMREIGQFAFDVLSLVKLDTDIAYDNVSSVNAITQVELQTKTEETKKLEFENYSLKAKLESWSETIDVMVDKARSISSCRHCLAQIYTSGNLLFERVDHPTDLRGILRCSRCRTKHSLD